MSVTVYWRVVAKSRHSDDVGWGSSFLEALRAVFGETPIRLVAADSDKLRAMDVAWRIGGGIYRSDNHPFDALADAVETHGTIEVWGES